MRSVITYPTDKSLSGGFAITNPPNSDLSVGSVVRCFIRITWLRPLKGEVKLFSLRGLFQR